MELIQVLIFGFILDLIFGDPKQLPHLIVWFGKLIGFGEKQLNHGNHLFYKGMFLTILLVSLAFIFPYITLKYLRADNGQSTVHSFYISVIFFFYCLANKTLVEEGKAVFNTLKQKGIVEGRKRLSWIVGRDTSQLSSQQIRLATLETLSENLSDGVIAPLFYFLCFGIPGMVAYKMINTFDSMIGYKNERYLHFGKFAAKLDDVANYIPSRLTACLMLIVSLKFGGFSFVFTEGKKHSSPNAGYPEAALAYILSCRFGGPNTYGGQVVNKPFIGNNDRLIEHHEIHQVGQINYKTSVLFVLISIAILSFV